MNYADARPQIRSGDLLAFSHATPWYKSFYDFKIALVRAFTQSEYSHVAIAWCVGERVLILEAVSAGVRLFPLSQCGDFYWLPLKAPWKPETLEYALAKLGQPYSQLQAMQAVFRLPSDDDLWQCAEYARRVALVDGVDLGPVATPTAVVRYAMANGCEARLILNGREK